MSLSLVVHVVIGLDSYFVSFVQRKAVALHPFSADIEPAAEPLAASADLVDLVDKDDAVLLDRGDRFAHHQLLIQELVALFGYQDAMALGDGHLLRLRARAKGLAEDVAEVEHPHLRARHAGDLERRQAGRSTLLHRDLDLAIVELALTQPLADLVAGVAAGAPAAPAHR